MQTNTGVQDQLTNHHVNELLLLKQSLGEDKALTPENRQSSIREAMEEVFQQSWHSPWHLLPGQLCLYPYRI